MKKNVLITGATGFLGSQILKELLNDDDICPTVLARSKKKESVNSRIEKTLKYFYGDKYKAFLKRVKIVEGSLETASLGLDDAIAENIIEETDEIYHSAAVAEFRVPLETIRKANVRGTNSIMEFAVKCKDRGRLKRVNHISTTYVAGTKEGVFYEKDIDVGQKFNNTYEQTKFEAELLVHEYMKKGLDVTIHRPSILIGDSVTGKTSNFKMLYQPLHFFSAELFEAIPADKDADENLIPVDLAARAICIIAKAKESVNKTYHIANTACVKVGHFLDVAGDFFGFKKPELVDKKDFDMKRLTFVQRNLIGPYIPYFNYKTGFDVANARSILERNGFHYQAVSDHLLIKLFKFCADSGFVKPKRRYVAAG